MGTRSLLIGVHQFLWHPWTVARAWRTLYGQWPDFRTWVCILVHDWGYAGCTSMDGDDGKLHPMTGAAIAGYLFGPEYHDLCLYHSRSLSKMHGREPSLLCWADKYSMLYDWRPFYLVRARLSGEIKEYRERAHDSNFIPLIATDEAWHRKLVAHLTAMSLKKAEPAKPSF